MNKKLWIPILSTTAFIPLMAMSCNHTKREYLEMSKEAENINNFLILKNTSLNELQHYETLRNELLQNTNLNEFESSLLKGIYFNDDYNIKKQIYNGVSAPFENDNFKFQIYINNNNQYVATNVIINKKLYEPYKTTYDIMERFINNTDLEIFNKRHLTKEQWEQLTEKPINSIKTPFKLAIENFLNKQYTNNFPIAKDLSFEINNLKINFDKEIRENKNNERIEYYIIPYLIIKATFDIDIKYKNKYLPKELIVNDKLKQTIYIQTDFINFNLIKQDEKRLSKLTGIKEVINVNSLDDLKEELSKHNKENKDINVEIKSAEARLENFNEIKEFFKNKYKD